MPVIQTIVMMTEYMDLYFLNTIRMSKISTPITKNTMT